MNDELRNIDTLAWRVKQLELGLRELRVDLRDELKRQTVISDTVIHQVREEMREDYLTKDSAATHYVSQDQVSKQRELHRQWPIILATCAAALAAILQAIEMLIK